jgi:hypothetical protein
MAYSPIYNEHIPQDINAELLLDYYPEGTVHVKFNGHHKRNAYGDILDIDYTQNTSVLSLGRNSLYNSLPEYIFHPIDRFDNLPQNNQKEKFSEEVAKQEKEKEDAYRFFAPIDTMLLQLRLDVRKVLSQYVDGNTLIEDILSDSLSDHQKCNKFIKKTIPLLSSCKNIRGNRTLLTLLLRKVFMEEGLQIELQNKKLLYTDEQPRYEDSIGANLNDTYIGNSYYEPTAVYAIKYWPEEGCDEKFLSLVDEIEEFRQFVQDYFLSIDSVLSFIIQKDSPTLRLSDTTVYNYLNYNTNI